MASIFLAKSNNPYENIAIEAAIFKQKEEALYLWINQPSIIMGRNQDACKEYNPEVLKRKNILPVRRLTGGGCVYHDFGNLNFSFFGKELNKDKWLQIIKDALETFGIHANTSGRNDLLVDGYKVSGTAYLQEDDWYVFHGTLMVDVNIEELVSVLQVSHLKYEGKGIDSIRSRVKNLCDFSNEITVSSLQCAIIDAYKKKFPDAEYRNISKDEKQYQILVSKDWIYSSNDFSLVIEKKVGNAIVQLHLFVENNKINHIKVYTDSLYIDLCGIIQNKLLNMEYSKLESILHSIEEEIR